ncbi:alpha-2,8-polysialyltransferase family protein [Vibrio cortegadensis]|uniref:alpha-2,8-polysialyltransferase family protein n=1 Tax=Vibrio cortegadensis TaxID=1328770 RepID=UPI0021C3F050|nr:alpha-2,8-polysialyltransferase family protein [Vibrio cortegadensis]MDN3697706.1 alpha-2,8-polysialyltransferase family protein [Vibrio cortegadensis]
MNVFVITSPFQYLCANEARLFYQTKNNILVYVEQEAERGKKNMSAILDESLWDEIIKIPRTQRTFRIPAVIKKIKNHNANIERIFLSEYHGWRSNLFIQNFPNTNIVYFDDGSATLVEHENLIRPQKPYIRRRIINDLLVALQGLKPANYVPYNNNLEIFSVFSLENDKCVIRKNKMLGLRKMLNSQACYDPSSNIGFIGEANINARPDCIQLDDYISELETILSKTDKCITYFPHRMEAEMVKKRVSLLERVQYHDSSFPIELEIAKSNLKLSQLIGYSSTALYTLSVIYSEIPIKILEPNNMASCQVALETNDIIKNQFKYK